MEHIDNRMRDDDRRSPHPTEDPTVPLIQADPSLSTPDGRESDAEDPAQSSLPSSTTDVQYDEKPPPRSQPLIRGFERPSFSRIAIFVVLCSTAYPAFYLLTFVAKDKSLFLVRLLVSTWCSVVGFALGYMLLKIGVQHLEAATWATVIHMSYEGSGMKLRDLNKGSSNPTSFVPAFHIFRSRFGNQDTARRSRKSYDKRPWSLFLGLFVILTILAPLLPFIFGRIMVIETFVRNQHKAYHEVLIAGDLSEEDVRQADDIGSLLLSDTTAFDTTEFSYGSETVYFAQPSPSQFVSGGSGAGTFDPPPKMGLKDTIDNPLVLSDRIVPRSNAGAVLRYSQWGTRIHCERLPNPEVNLVFISRQSPTFGLALVPRDFLQGLFGVYGVGLPTELMGLELDDQDADDPTLSTALSNVDPSTISYFARSSNTASGSYLDHNAPYTVGDQGWVTVETLFIHVNTSFAPSGHFPVYSNEWLLVGENGTEFMSDFQIGHDAAVCVQIYEPWIIEAYISSTGSSFALKIIEKGNGSTSLSPSGNMRGTPIADTKYLNTTGKDIAFSKAYYKSVRRMAEANYDLGTNSFDFGVPSPIVVSFTNGTGPKGYTELSPDRFGAIRARSSAANALPYLAGSAHIVAHLYTDETLADTTFKWWQLMIPLLVTLILGIIGELFVPTLPLNIPRREFGVYSWLALFQSQELRVEAADELDKLMSLKELEEKFSDRRVKFTSLNVERDDQDHGDV